MSSSLCVYSTSSLLHIAVNLISLIAFVTAKSGPPSPQTHVLFSDQHQLRPGQIEPIDVFPITPNIPDMATATQTFVSLKTRPTAVHRPRSLDVFQQARLRSLRSQESLAERVEWDIVHLDGPDIEDLHTLSQLGRMSGNAYETVRGQKDWYDIDPAWNISFPVGYENAEDGFRGHVFLSSDNSTIILSIKGTTLQGPTSKKDKYNDNLLFSCCCARVDISWTFNQVCGCYRYGWRCDNTCLSDALIEDSLFYTVGVNLVNDLLTVYPSSNLWLVGHSLGGSLASLLGSTFGLPAVAFEAPGERLAAERLHIPLPPSSASNDEHSIRVHPQASESPTIHVYHNSDPIPQGACTGFGSPCAQAGYALETRCHLGKSIVFDTIGKLGWRVDVRTHVIKSVITEVLEADGVEWEEGRQVPEAKEEIGCVECFKWEFGDFGK